MLRLVHCSIYSDLDHEQRAGLGVALQGILTTMDILSTQSQSSRSVASMLFSTVFSSLHWILLSLLLLRPLYRRYSSPLRRFPGPFVASCTRLWKGNWLQSLQCYTEPPWQKWEALADTFPPVFSLEHLDWPHRATPH